MEELWRYTQTPELHEQWDLRFTSITYLERANDSEPQRFRYATRIGLGWEIQGWGETVGERASDGVRTSALKFGSDDRWSLIRAGAGYWKYEPVGDELRFLTGYDYQVRWGFFGRLLDRFFRPLIGWATAWSFDCLRLWIESGVEPRRAVRQALVHALATLTVAFVWIWHGFVPKLAGPHPDELAMLLEAGISAPWLRTVALAVGAIELAFGVMFPFLSRRRWPWIVTLVLMLVATVGVLVNSPHRAVAAFGPITVNLQLAVLAVIGLLSLRELPSAARCLRSAPQENGKAQS